MIENYSMNLRIRKKTISEWLLLFLFLFPFFQSFISEFLKVPDVVKFLCDVCLMFLFLRLLMHRKIEIYRPLLPFAVLVISFFVYTLISYFVNYQSIFYFLWGTRNNFRLYIAFFAFALLVKWEDAKKWIEILDWFYIVNFFVVLYQFFAGHSQDYLGGIFGVLRGCNGATALFLSVVVARSVLLFMNGQGNKFKTIFIIVSSLLISAFAELKIFFVFFILILFVAAILTEHSIRKTILFALGGFIIFAFSTLLSLLYDDFIEFLSIENLWAALINPNYATEEDMGRFTAIPIITQRFLTNLPQRLFGMGIGNCDSSSLSIFNSTFYSTNYTTHYLYFLYALLFLETGVIGLALYVSFFVLVFVKTVQLYKKGVADKGACQLAIIISLICIIMTFYNISLRVEIGFLIYFVLALPIIAARYQQNT